MDIDTLNVIEDYLDGWPGTLIVVSHDRWFLERTCDVQYALLGDGNCVLLPGGVEEYLERRAAATSAPPATATVSAASSAPSDAAQQRQARKDLSRVESQLSKLGARIESLHLAIAENASDYAKLVDLGAELDQALARQTELEEQWLELAEAVAER